ncbi:hypothetical protein BOX15_Mlig010865g2 [Macrostomum lignano]|uniref:Uncharacterized protein n=1 Tax=Macrostomum lignano TaxID=282301 RepID=A0A267FZ76_9PLAT|nr:hypothetical protein BOX15_Mlig010865g2 [Macrostomum lignano]
MSTNLTHFIAVLTVLLTASQLVDLGHGCPISLTKSIVKSSFKGGQRFVNKKLYQLADKIHDPGRNTVAATTQRMAEAAANKATAKAVNKHGLARPGQLPGQLSPGKVPPQSKKVENLNKVMSGLDKVKTKVEKEAAKKAMKQAMGR